MPRSLWNGTIAFGLVRVPVKLYSATESKRIALRERHAPDGAAIEHRRICAKEQREVPYGEIVKGFEVGSGSYVSLTKEEVAVADGSQARLVDVEHFVDGGEIDPSYYERAYYVGPGKHGEEAYRLLHAALKRSGRVGIGRFVFHNKAHLAALRALDEVLVLHTMRFADEFVPAGELEVPAPKKAPSKLELDTAQLLIDQLDSSFEPKRYRDTYREALVALIERKARGEAIKAPQSEPSTQESSDLLSSLRASFEEHGGGRRHTGKGPHPATAARGGRARTRGAR